jgi:hypothetical protein
MFCFKEMMWLKVKNIPENHPNWYASTDRLLGYQESGDSSDDSTPWEIKFVGLPFKYFMFAHKNIRDSLPLGADLWIIMDRNDVMSIDQDNDDGDEMSVTAEATSLNSQSNVVKGVFHSPFWLNDPTGAGEV